MGERERTQCPEISSTARAINRCAYGERKRCWVRKVDIEGETVVEGERRREQ